MQKTPVILVRSLKFERGGITRASIKRANMLAQKYKKVYIVTILFQQFHNDIISNLYKNGVLDKKVQVLNFFEYYKANHKKLFLRKQVQHKVNEKGFEVVQINQEEFTGYRYYEEGFYRKYKRYDDLGRLILIDHMDDAGNRIKREYYDEDEYLTRINFYNAHTKKIHFEQYFDKSGKCFLSVDIGYQPKRKENFSVYFGGKVESFATLYEMQKKWLGKVLKTMANPIVFSEMRRLDNMLLSVKHKSIKKVAVVHANHLASPYENYLNIDKSYENLFRKIGQFDKVVLLTKEQKKDIVTKVGKTDYFTVIPHAHEPLSIKNNKISTQRRNNVAVALTRYHPDKRLTESIEAFKQVVQKIPEAKLEIYGYGPSENELQNLIKKLGLENNVFLKGFSSKPKETYSSAACSLLTSIREGFGMVITESMAMGTPVVAYDFKYGPRDIIEDNVNGFLVENGNQEQLAERIISIMTNDELRDKLSKNALEVREKFSEKKYMQNWIDLIESL
ncbi:glycosyltransferase [Ornithinibacillus sp. 4-3]|uniref:Glycosyltransferase n=1 Tax=Ornithinibacillus sp. 4-3 TaxID=3231488 RepID=A0AB39HKM1_9BACI